MPGPLPHDWYGQQQQQSNTPPPASPPPLGGLTGNSVLDLASIVQDWARSINPTIYAAPNLSPIAPSWIEQTLAPKGDKWISGVSNTANPLAGAPQFWYTGSDPSSLMDDMVYMGKQSAKNVPQAHISLPGESLDAGGPRTQADAITVQAAINEPYLWSQEKVLATEKKMRESGMNVQSFDDMMKAWSSLVVRASRTFTLSGGKHAVTPWDMLASVKQESIDAGILDKNGNLTRTATHTSVFNVSDGDAWAAMKQMTANLLGHDPTEQEVRDFASRASNVAANHPTTTTTTSTTNAETGNTTSSSQTQSGFDSNDLTHMAYTDAQASPEYGAYQASSTYFNALLQAIGEVAPMGA